MGTLYVRFKNKDELEIPNINARKLEETIAQFPENTRFLIFNQSNQIINLKEINYMEIIESEEK